MREKDRTRAWVRAAQAGDTPAFEELVRSYQDLAVAYAASLLRDRDLAEDAAQEAFVEAYRTLPALREPGAFAGWLRALVFKHCDRMTRRKRLPVTGLEAALDAPSPEPTPEEMVERREAGRTVRAAVAALPEADRTAALLYYMGGRTHGEIAEFLGVTPNAVKTRLYAARKRLRRQMADEIGENLQAARPSSDTRFAEKVARMIRPEALKKNEPLIWSAGIGADVWKTFCAALTGDLKALRRLMRKDPSLARAEYEYHTAMFFAVRENQLEAARFLLERGADPVHSGTPDTLLQMARDRGYAEMQSLLEAAISGAQGGSPGGEPLAAAIRAHDLAKVQGMLDASPELLHAVDERANQPIHWAVMTRQPDIIDELHTRGADLNAQRADGARPIHLTNGDYHYRGWRDVPQDWPVTPDDVFKHLRACGAVVDIGMAAAKGDIERVRELLDEDPSLANRVSDYNSYYIGCGAPLKNAAATGHIEVVQLLLERGADPNLPEEGIAPRGHALYSAVANGHYEIAKLLLEHGAYPNVEVESSADTLSRALSNDDRKMSDLLCSYGAARKVHLLAHYNDLMTAAAVFAANPALADDPDALGSAGSDAFVRLMLRYQPDLPRRVTVAKSRELTGLLFQHGMDPNRPNWLRITPLHRFAEMGDVESAALFLDHGADLHARDEEIDSTPLGWAAKHGKALMVEFLLSRGATPTLPDDPPWATPMAWATRRGHDRVVRLLEQYESEGALPARPLAFYESLAVDFVEAFNSGDPDAAHRITDHFQFDRTVTWEKLRRRVEERLRERSDSNDASDALALDDARTLVARMHGDEDWEQLLNRVTG
ncbi:MAG: sigma-70 family RNA polymerase sigma factor [Armatimonadetes bacterium]|nr:sigma-70 family RNA polymerase sigma factor [Armatimonadota bacterium]